VGSDARSPGETVMEDKATDKTAGGVAVAAGLVAAVKLAPSRIQRSWTTEALV
jgi:hypothetical protein